MSLLNLDEADSAIPELTAFWQFLKREYQNQNATPILKFLNKIEPQFKGMMNDPNNFGIAKSFFMAGTAAGFDLTTEEGLKAFQEDYNQNQGKAGANSPFSGELGMLLGNFQPPVISPEEDVQQDRETKIEGIEDYERELRNSIWQEVAEEFPPLPEEAIALLQQQNITETKPGMILQDFQTLLDFIGEKGVTVSGKQHCLPMKSLAELNQRLSNPIDNALKRPQQKSYPPINGLYLLLRASGLGQIVSRGKKYFLMLNRELLSSWDSFNPTERYFALLEAWMIRAHEEILGERRTPLNEGTKCLQYWPRIPNQGQKIRNYGEQQSLSYGPELHNLALMQLFGLLQVDSGKPEAGKGWRVKKVQKLPFGEALMQVMVRAFIERGMMWESEENFSLALGELQPVFQPYFPEWQNTLSLPELEFRSGVYIFKVHLGKIWRRIAISSQMTLEEFSSLILQSVNFDYDHLDMFRYKNQIGRTVEISHPYADGSPSTNEVCIGDLPLKEGASMTYIFDFGDWWEFNIQLEKIDTNDLRTNYGAIVESKGSAPLQYPNWEEDIDDYD